MEAALGEAEAKRLEVLDRYKGPDVPSEGDFDDLVRLAAQLSHAPMSFLSMVERERLWFKGRYGLDVTEVPRHVSFCAQAILHSGPLEIVDATQDARFAHTELVSGPVHVRYYFGVPLVTPDGYALGTLCVLDKRPRRLTPEQKEALCILGREAMKQLELRRRLAATSQELNQAQTDVQSMALKESEARLRLAVETAELGMYERELLTNKVTINETCRRIFGLGSELPPPDVAPRSVHPEDKQRVLAAVARAFDPAVREVCVAEFRIVRPDGSICWVAGRGRAIFEDEPGPARACKFIGVLNDITERKRLEAELQRQAASLERLVEERTAKLAETVAELEHFSYTITHDMRAPLRAMRSFAKMLLAGPPEALEPATRADLLRRISEGALRMDLLITDALDYSRVVRSEMVHKPISPSALIQGIVESYPQFHPPKADIQIQPDIPPVLAGEAGLTQCFSNLLGNAVKFVEPGITPRIRVWAETRAPVQDRASSPAGAASAEPPAAANGPRHMVRIWVEDNGIGIAPEYQPKIWQMFQRLSKSYEGTGIGLALVRKVLERMGGLAGVESELGHGSRFWVELRSAA